MNIEGLDYNTQREPLFMPEYGREIQQMVDIAVDIPNRNERQRCAETIVNIMRRMTIQKRSSEDFEHKLWDHLALMSGFRLDIDYPFDISNAAQISNKPEPMKYPMKKIPVRHYGSMVFDTLEKLKSMPDGEERDRLTQMIANQMKRNLVQWGHGAPDDEKIVADLEQFTDGRIHISTSDVAKDSRYGNDKKKKKKVADRLTAIK